MILHSYPQVGDRENSLEMMCFETTKATPSDTPPSTRPCLLILSKQFYQLGTKYSHTSVWVQFSFKPTQVPSEIGRLKTTDNIDVIAHKSSSQREKSCILLAPPSIEISAIFLCSNFIKMSLFLDWNLLALEAKMCHWLFWFFGLVLSQHLSFAL